MSAWATSDLQRRVVSAFGGYRSNEKLPRHTVVFEVRVTDPSAKRGGFRSIDAVACGHLAEPDHLLHGIEIKSTKDNWRTEWCTPEKSAAAREQVDRWWLVVPDLTVVKGAAPPDDWGLLIPGSRRAGLITVRDAGPQAGRRSPAFMASLVGRAFRSGQQARDSADAAVERCGMEELAALEREEAMWTR